MDINEQLQTDVSVIASLEALADGIIAVMGKVVKTGGMSKQFALEAVALDEGIFTGTPMAYFTTQPTATQLAASLENMATAIWEAIKKVAKAIADTVKKFIDWLFGRGKKEEELVVVQKLLVDSTPKNNKTRDLLKKWEIEMSQQGGIIDVDVRDVAAVESFGLEDNSLDFRPNSPGAIDEMLSKYAKANPDSAVAGILLSKSGLYSDVLHNGPFSQIMRTYRQTLGGLHDVFREIDSGNKTIIAELQKTKSAVYTGDAAFTASMEKIISKGEHKIKSPFGSTETEISAVVDNVNKVRADSIARPIEKEIKFSELNDIYLRAVESSSIVDMLNIISKYDQVFGVITHQFDEIEKLLGDYKSFKGSDQALAELSQTINKAMKVMRMDLSGSLKLVAHVKSYANLLVQVDAQVARSQKTAVDLVEKMMHAAGAKMGDKAAATARELKQSLDFT